MGDRSRQGGAGDLSDASGDKAELRRHFRRLRRQALPAASAGLRQRALTELPPLLAAGRRLGLYWPVGSEPDLEPRTAGGLAERLPAGMALPAVLPAKAVGPPPVAAGATSSPPPRTGLAAEAAPPPVPLDAAPDRLIYLPWAAEELRGRDACGIPVPLPPPGSAWRELAADELGLLLVPALAIDQHGIRLGSGGGWYDRLRADPAWRAVPALAVLPAACVCQALPRDPWDVPFAGWLDERGVAWLEPRR